MDRQLHLVLLLAFALPCGSARATDAGFGELPAGAISTSEMRGVGAEICRDHLFDPKSAKAELPVGYRRIPAEEAAKTSPVLETLLRADPRLRGHALGSLCFLSVESFAVDDAPVYARGPVSMAFWWAQAEGPRHADMRGKVEWVQLGSWYPSDTPRRAAVLSTDPMAEFVDVTVERIEADAWRLRLALPGETVEAGVRSSGPPRPSRSPQPGFMSVPMSGGSAGYFLVFTYFGHVHRPAQGKWRASGNGVFSIHQWGQTR